METKLVVFQDKEIRRLLVDNVWFFAVVDVITALTSSDKPRDYWYRMKKREIDPTGIELSTFCRQLKLESSDGKKYMTEMGNTESIFRIIQSIPSPKAEPFKRLAGQGWLRTGTGDRRSGTGNGPDAGIVQGQGVFGSLD